jgi:hypothetical protein
LIANISEITYDVVSGSLYGNSRKLRRCNETVLSILGWKSNYAHGQDRALQRQAGDCDFVTSANRERMKTSFRGLLRGRGFLLHQLQDLPLVVLRERNE